MVSLATHVAEDDHFRYIVTFTNTSDSHVLDDLDHPPRAGLKTLLVFQYIHSRSVLLSASICTKLLNLVFIQYRRLKDFYNRKNIYHPVVSQKS